LAFTPMTVFAFATLRTYQIAEASGVFTLVRNFGSSLFISVAVVLLVRSTTENYGRITEFINPVNKAFHGVSDPWNIEMASGLMRLSNEIQRQPAMIGYVNSIHLLALVAAVGVPLVMVHAPADRPCLIAPPQSGAGERRNDSCRSLIVGLNRLPAEPVAVGWSSGRPIRLLPRRQRCTSRRPRYSRSSPPGD
jgi:hypothetical protein